jgi:hypothetical protein
MSVTPNRRQPPLSTDSRVAVGCGLTTSAECQNGTFLENAGHFRNSLIIATLAVFPLRRTKIF